MKTAIKKILRRPHHMLRRAFKTNWCKTLRVNFSLLPFSQAIKLPIVVTGRLKIDSLKGGRVVFDCPVKYGLVIIGRCLDNMPIELSRTRLMVNGTLIFKGYCLINHSTNIVVWKNGVMEIGDYVLIGSGIVLKSVNSVKVGDFTRLASGCFVMDSNVHCIKDAVTGRVARIFNPIEIGKHCWLTMNTAVMAGAKIPDYSISTRGALLNRDYTTTGEIGCLLVGTPAKIAKSNLFRIHNLQLETEITKFFYDNPDAEFYQGEPGFESAQDIDLSAIFRL